MFLIMGDDFRYANARQNFDSLDKLIFHFNNLYSDVQLQYSTPRMYIDAITAGDNSKILWPTKYDDMFPYADNALSFWTGYFTSRPDAKEYVRRGSHNLHASQKAYGLEIID